MKEKQNKNNAKTEQKEDILFRFEKSIEVWDEAVPLGNGDVGALMWGSGDDFRITLDKGDIWDTSFTPQEQVKHYNFRELKTMVEKNQHGRMYRTFDAPYGMPYPTKLPAGRLSMKIGGGNVVSELNITKAEAKIRCDKGTMRCIIHATERVGMLSSDFAIMPDVQNPKFGVAKKWRKYKVKIGTGFSSKMKSLKYPPVKKTTGEIKGEPNFYTVYFEQETRENFSYGIIVVGEKGGKNIAFYVANSKEKNWIENTTKRLVSALKAGYDKMLISHTEWWKSFWEKSSITLPNKLLEKQWYLNNYVLGSASKKGYFPMPLQGLWTADDDVNLPPWKGDYHHDLNTELTYYSYLKANRLEQGEVFLEYLSGLTDEAKKFARDFFDADGMCFPGVMDIRGKSLGGWAMYSLSPTNQIWLSQSFERYYSHTGDNEFLKKVGYPFLNQTGNFIKSILNTDKDGYYVLPLSSSPEYHENGRNAYMLPNTNYDLALLKYLFKKLSELGNATNESTDVWKNYSEKLHPFALTKEGIMMLSREEKMTESHRHLSVAMAVHPLRLIKNKSNEERKIINATIDDIIKLGTKKWVGYTFCWLAELLVIAKRGAEAEKNLETFFKYFCLPNGFHCNGDYTKQGICDGTYRPFTLEGNFCAADAIQEMLLYGEDGEIEIFPAIPESWKECSFETFRTIGGLLVSATLENGKLKTATLVATNNVEFSLLNNVDGYVVLGGKIENDKITLKKGEIMSISIAG